MYKYIEYPVEVLNLVHDATVLIAGKDGGKEGMK
jgi:hypothetical protein